MKSAGVMPWRWAISNNSTIAHSTTSGLGSASSRILFIVTFRRHAFFTQQDATHIHQIPRDFRWIVEPLSVQNCTLSRIDELAGWVSRGGDGCRTGRCPRTRAGGGQNRERGVGQGEGGSRIFPDRYYPRNNYLPPSSERRLFELNQAAFRVKD